MKKIGFLVALVALVAVPGMAANSLSVTGAAALEGNYGLQVNIDPANNTTDAYVVTDHPDHETTYNVEFRIHPGTLSMNTTNAFRFFVIGDIRKETPDRNFFFVYILKTQDGWWRVQANARNDNGAFPPWQNSVALCSDPGGSLPCSGVSYVTIRLEWQASTGPGANNGSMKIYRDGVLARTFSNLDNDTQSVGASWWGAIFMTNGGQNGPTPATGHYYFDSFVSTR